jgi:beta-1,2-mannobiose phosphorylase / 1,2-beta-oligomannan phosphorylase
MQVSVKREDIRFLPDSTRVIARFLFTGEIRAINIIQSVLKMSENDVSMALRQVLRDYSLRHRNISRIFEKHYNQIEYLLPQAGFHAESINKSHRILLGAYFTMEYSIESAALFNPSVVEHPDQSDVNPGETRVIISLRATGEGHISSIVFRTGVLDKNNKLTVEPVGSMREEAELVWRHIYDKESFKKQLDEMDELHSIIPSELILDKLKDQFTYGELRQCIEKARKTLHLAADKELLFNQIIWLASSHYELQFSLDTNLSERVIFPVSVNERNGIEDARFVKFTNEDGSIGYYATYTAYNGLTILPKLLHTKDFYHFEMMPVHGEIAHNKGMALFPRKVNGKFAMLCRLDGVNNYISFSDNISVWRKATMLQQPKHPWEYVQIGNCGSPIETEDGWLVLTHGVGPMREYAIGVALLDLENPEIEIGRLEYPLLVPNKEEREGYVPNVVYSCGSIINNDELVIPYAMSDYASTYATVKIKELLEALKNSK